jgi:integral membrane protein
VRNALLFYRVMAYVVGVGLLILVLVAMPLKYLADSEGLIGIVGPLHGFLYMVYLVATVGLAFRSRWTPVKTVLVMLAGTVPFVSFVVERRVAAEEKVS